MKKVLLLVLGFVLFGLLFGSIQLEAKGELQFIPETKYYKAEVLEVSREKEIVDISESISQEYISQKARVEILNGDEKTKKVELEFGLFPETENHLKVEEGNKIIITKNKTPEGYFYSYYDRYRAPSLLWVFIVFLVLVIVVSRLKGFTSVLGLGFSLVVIVFFVVPQILDGRNPLLVSLLASLVIAFVSIYLAHGFNKRTTVVVGSVILTLFVVGLLSIVFVDFTSLFGLGSEDVFDLQITDNNVDFRGLLLGGIMISCLGILDDVAAAQAATVDEIRKANPNFSVTEVYKRALKVGREHIASMVNTLILIYAGASLPILMLFDIDTMTPNWVNINREIIAEEVVRSLLGSIALILAVPITTYLSAYFLDRFEKNDKLKEK